MPQICPSPSGQLAAASLAFHRARRKFPKNLGACACSGDTKITNTRVYPAIVEARIPIVNNILLEPIPKTERSFSSNPQGRGNHASYQSLSLSRTASLSNNCRGDQRGDDPRGEMMCAACGKRTGSPKTNEERVYDPRKHQERTIGVKAVPYSSKTLISRSRRACGRIKAAESGESNQSCIETASKSTHSSAGKKKKKQSRHRRACVHTARIWSAGSRSPKKNQGSSQICLLHGYPAARRQSSIPRKPQTIKYYNRKTSTPGNSRLGEEREKIYRYDSPTVVDLPKKIQSWEHRTYQGSYARDDVNTGSRRGEILCRQCPKTKNNQIPDLSGNMENSVHRLAKKPEEQIPNEDVCLRPSLIKAAQRKMDLDIRGGGRSHKNSKICDHLSENPDTKSTWNENLNVINHKDSMSIIMERFRGKSKQQNPKLQNIYELNSASGSKTSCCEGELIRSENINRRTNSTTNQSLLQNFDDNESTETKFLPRKSSSGVNPVTKLGRVANQGLRENENHFKNLRSRLNQSGICCSSIETPWRRDF